MDQWAILITLVVYQAVLLGIGLFAQRRTRDAADLYLGGRRLGPLVAAISAAASSSSAWTLLSVSGMAYMSGLSAVWLFPACVGGFALNWFVVAPRLRRHSGQTGALTLTEVLAGGTPAKGRRLVVWTASIITLVSLLTYVASQFNGAAKSFAPFFEGLDPEHAILIGSGVVVIYTMIGGFWAVSLTDTLQGLVMAATAVALPVVALVHVGGFGELFEKLAATQGPAYLGLTQDLPLVAGIGFVFGLSGITLGYPGQPHVVNRFMALRREEDIRLARRYSMAWAVLVYAGMILLGLCARVALGDPVGDYDKEQAFFDVANKILPTVVAGMMLAAVLSAIMSTADSQLLVAASTVSHDLGLRGKTEKTRLLRDRLVILGLSAGAIFAALYGSREIYQKVLFAWSSMGAAFAPLLFWILWRGQVATRVAVATMLTGFGAAIVFYYFPIHTWIGGDDWHNFDKFCMPYLLSTTVMLVGGLSSRARPTSSG